MKVAPFRIRISVLVAVIFYALDAATVPLDDAHVKERLRDYLVARPRRMRGFQEKLHRHVERKLTWTGNAQRILKDFHLNVIRRALVTMTERIGERFTDLR